MGMHISYTIGFMPDLNFASNLMHFWQEYANSVSITAHVNQPKEPKISSLSTSKRCYHIYKYMVQKVEREFKIDILFIICGTVLEEDKLSFFSGLLQEIYVGRDDVCVWKQL